MQEEAKGYLKQLIIDYPESELLGKAYYALAMMSLDQGRKKMALEFLDKIEKGDIIFLEASLLKVDLLLDRGRLDEAENLLTSLP